MAGLVLLILLCIVMATASFFAGALPLTVTLTPSQLRLISSVGVGVLVGTSLIVIIPEGIEAVSSQALAAAQHNGQHAARGLLRRLPRGLALEARHLLREAETEIKLWNESDVESSVDKTLRKVTDTPVETEAEHDQQSAHGWHDPHNEETPNGSTSKSESPQGSERESAPDKSQGSSPDHKHEDDEHEHGAEIPGTQIGLALVLGFILMFLIDRLPQHASESLHSEPQTQQFSMDSLTEDGAGADEAQGFLGSLAPTAKSARSFATTVGLVIHAAADGIALGASSSTSDMKLGFIIFFAIMIHKAPAAFGLTSVLLKQGLSKRLARAHLIIFSLAAPVGALSTWLLLALLGGGNMDGPGGHWWTGMLLLFSGGTFLYVAMHAMQETGSHGSPAANGSASYGDSPARKAETNTMRDTMATTVGMLLPLLTQFGHHHH